MPFTIPNEADAGNSNQAEPDSVDFDILTYGAGATGVVDGCAVSAQGTPDMTVAVAAGSVSIAGRQVAVTAGNGTITAADGTNPRFDMVTINTSGTIVVTAGTAAASPVFPAHPADVVVLAAVYVAASDTAIQSGEIVDKRVIIGAMSANTMGSAIYSSGVAFDPVHAISIGSSQAGAHIANRFYCWGFILAADVTVNALIMEVGLAGVANARIGIYEGDGSNFEPKTLIVDSGVIDCSTAGIKTASVTAFTLKAGIVYHIGFFSDQSNAVWWPRGSNKTSGALRQVYGWNKATSLQTKVWVGAAPLITFGALPDPITGTTTWVGSSIATPYFLLDVV